MKIKKKGSVFKILILLGMLLSLVGCSELIGFDTNKMIQAPRLPAEYEQIKSAIRQKEGDREISLVLPLTLTDPDNSAVKIKDDLAIVSFKYDDEAYGCIALLQNEYGQWKLVNTMKKSLHVVDMISFVDFDGTGDVKVIVSWLNNGSRKSSISVYDSRGILLSEISNNDGSASNVDGTNIFKNFTLCDINNDGKVEVIVFLSSPAKDKNMVRAYNFNGNFIPLSECELQDEYVKYFAITIGKIDSNHTGIFLDGDYYDSNEYFCTDAIYWDNGKLVHVSKNFFVNSMRFINEKSRDVDGDGIIEVPNIEELVELDKYDNKSPGISVIWKKWSIQNDKGVAVKNKSYVYNNYARYAVMIPDRWFKSDESNVVLSLIDNSEKKMTFYEKQSFTPLFEIKTFTKDEWNGSSKDEYSEITLNEENKKDNKNKNLVYAVKYLSDNDLKIPLDELESRFVFL